MSKRPIGIASIPGAKPTEAERGNGESVADGLIANQFAAQAFTAVPADLGAIGKGMVDAARRVQDGDLSDMEMILSAQIVTLNTVFTELTRRAGANLGKSIDVVETYLRLAMKAQAQTARTVEVLGNLRAGPTVFAKQANFATGPQQVNNGTLAPAQESPKPKNGLLKDARHEQEQGMVPGAQAAPARGDTAVEAVGEVHGTKNRGRQGQGGTQ